MPRFIVWSTGAVRADLIETVRVPESETSDPFFALSNGSQPCFPRADLPDVLKQLREAYVVSTAS